MLIRLLLLIPLAVLVGCGENYNTSQVTGRITLDGAPIAGASVTFQPVEGGTGMPAVGMTDDNGEYSVTDMRGGDFGSGAVPGDYMVGIQWFAPSSTATASATSEDGDDATEEASETAKGDHNKVTGPESKLPEKYQNPKTSELTASVASGSNEFNFELSSK